MLPREPEAGLVIEGRITLFELASTDLNLAFELGRSVSTHAVGRWPRAASALSSSVFHPFKPELAT